MGFASLFITGAASALTAAKAAATITVTTNFVVISVDGLSDNEFNGIGFGDSGHVTFVVDENTPGDLSNYDFFGAANYQNAITSISGSLKDLSFSANGLSNSVYALADAPIFAANDSITFDVNDDIETSQADFTLLDVNARYFDADPSTFSGPSITGSILNLQPATVENFMTQELTLGFRKSANGNNSFATIGGFITTTEVTQMPDEAIAVPQLRVSASAGGSFEVEFESQSGVSYQLQRATVALDALSEEDWISLTHPEASASGDGTILTLSDVGAISAYDTAWYRVVAE